MYFLYFCKIWLADSQQKKKLRILISFDLGYLDSYIVSGCQGETQFFQNGKKTLSSLEDFDKRVCQHSYYSGLEADINQDYPSPPPVSG